ncbi:tyrosine-type recombinase/integrase [Luteibacter sp. CQ10]|uniref:tyrosine-type recombinase/integrase n=1 Tax=Luteibacter sp. CQ10 TaxID=2805821 RepID=UPI0034A5B18B
MPKPYILKRPAGWHARYFVPLVLQPLLGSRYLVLSLQGERGDAARLSAARIGYVLSRVFEWMRRNPVEKPKDLLATALAAARKKIDLIIELPDGTRITTDGSPAENAAAERIMAERERIRLGAEAPSGTGVARPASAGRDPMSARIEKHLSYMRGKALSEKNVLDSEYTLGLFVALVGDKAIGDIQPDDVESFLAMLVDYPANASKKKQYRGLLPPAVLAKARSDGASGLSLRTREKHLDRLRSFFGHHVKQHRLPFNPCDGYSVTTKAQDAERSREPFSKEDLALISRNLISQVPHEYWGPILALHSGARINELAQLKLDDVEEVSGIWGMHFRRKTKNAGSRRFVPLHPEVLRLGFLDYLREVRRYGFDVVFPGIHDKAGEPGDVIGDWFNRTFLRKRCGIVSPTKVLHSFRHNFSTAAERAGIPDARIGQLTGHSAGKSVLRTHYIQPATLPERLADLSKISFPEFKVLVRKAALFEHYLRRTRAVGERQARTPSDARQVISK